MTEKKKSNLFEKTDEKISAYLRSRNFGEKTIASLRHVGICLVLLLISVLAEIFIFNYKHWTSLSYDEIDMPLSLGSAYTICEDGSFYIGEGDQYIEITDIDTEIHNAYVKVVSLNDQNTDQQNIRVDFDAKDASHSDYYSLNKRVICASEPRSFYVTFHLYGDAKALKIATYFNQDQYISIEIRLNVKVPLFFNWERIAVLFGILLLIVYLRPRKYLDDIKYSALSLRTRIILMCIFFLLNAGILYWANGLNPYYQGEAGINTEQYQKLAEAFAEGSVSLLYEPCDALKNLENPYDTSARNAVMEFGEWCFDHAYYNGKYYVYFGALPVVLLYLPYYLITGEHIHNHVVCFIGILFILAAFILIVDTFVRRHAKKCSVGIWFLLNELLLIGSYVVYVDKRPDLYSVPIIWALAFGLWGLWFFAKAIPEDKDKSDTLNIPFLAAGSLCTALVTGCRPQIFLIVILDVLLLRKYAFSWKYLKTSNGIKAIVAVFVPMALVGSIVMAYNYARFGSPFDFGAFYNLTFNDMRNRGFVFDRIPYGASVYLLRPLEFNPEYPYFYNIYQNTKYMGETIQETTYGGVFMSSPFALVSFFSFFYWKKLSKNNRTLHLMSVSSILIALVIMVFDTVNSGILARYFFDFSFLWMLAAVFTVINILSVKGIRKTGVYNALIWGMIVILIFEIFYQMNVFMLDSGDYLMGNRKDLFYHYYYLFSFMI